jgi:hypothetical protein
MGILDFLRPPAYRGSVVGNLVRQGRYWRGVIKLGSERGVPSLLAGPRAGPGESSLGLARELDQRYATLIPAIERALFEHYEPYIEAGESGEREYAREVPRLVQSKCWGMCPEGSVPGWALTELNGSVI